jgi:asparaginyl-tRNA synthetase
VLRVQNVVLDTARRFLRDEGFTELLPPIIGPVTDPGARGSKQVDVDYYGHPYKLMSSGILYKQASLRAFERVLNVAPNVRLEPIETAATHRHLTEFHQLDVELARARRDEAMSLAERLLSALVSEVSTTMGGEIGALGQEINVLRPACETPYRRITHAEAVQELGALGHAQDAGSEISWRAEELLSRTAEAPFFVTDYPKGARGFYDREDPETPGSLRNFDLLAPNGFGELASGGEREHLYRNIIMRLRETGENPRKYGWYIDLARDGGIPPSAGFGMGVERLTRYLCGLGAVWQASAYPKVPGQVTP